MRTMDFKPGDKVTMRHAKVVGEVTRVAQLSFAQSDCVSRAVVYVRWPSGSIGRHVEGQLAHAAKVADVVAEKEERR